MPRNSSGTYTVPSGTSAVSGDTIDSAAYNALISDLNAEITNSLDRNGRSSMSAHLPMGGYKVTGVGTPSASTDGATKGYVDTALDTFSGSLADVATTGAYSDISGTPTLSTVAGTGVYSDLTGKPSLYPIGGAYRNLLVKNSSGTPDTQIDITASALTVELADGSAVYALRNVSVTANGSSSGANGLDAGSLAASTWYFSYVIYNPLTLTTASLLSASATAPTLPSGYTAYARVGAHLTDGSVAFYRVRQVGNIAQYVVTAATNTTSMRRIGSGSGGNPTTPTWSAISIASYAPSTATRAMLSANATTGAVTIVAPNSAYGGYTSTTNQPVAFARDNQTVACEITLESSNVYWASTGGYLFCSGWVDNI